MQPAENINNQTTVLRQSSQAVTSLALSLKILAVAITLPMTSPTLNCAISHEADMFYSYRIPSL